MNRPIRSAAVLGSGVMGSAIAAHLANAGIPSLVLDIVPTETSPAEQAAGLTLKDRKVRDRIARESVGRLAKTRPAALFTPQRMLWIETGNLEDDLARISDADWVIEVVREDMEIKKTLLTRVAEHLAPQAILTSNTSGLSLSTMAEVLPESIRPRFLGTHFFNPPRYMRLLELIPTEHTSSDVLRWMTEFATVRLGKGVVAAKDTPNFIANRIGVHSLMVTLNLLADSDLTIEEIDALTGPAMGRPKTATFRLADLVGLDTLLYVARTVQGVAGDESRETFAAPELLRKMVEQGRLGLKSGAGFYKKVRGDKRKKIQVIDKHSLEYRDPQPAEFAELKALSRMEDPGQRLRSLTEGDSRAASAAWRILGPTLSYSAMRLGEIADDAMTIDRAIRLGFNWELGPFEVWDALGFRQTVERLRSDGLPLPEWVEAGYRSGAETIYGEQDGKRQSPTARPGQSVPIDFDERHFDLDRLRSDGREVRRNDSASLFDLGDEVLGLEFHSKMNAIDDGTVEMILAAADEAETRWQALVVANQGDNFSAGANLKLLVEYAEAGNWKAIESIIRDFQRATTRLERCSVPVVVAPHGMALGGGCEVVLAGNAIQAAAESYIGLVEIGAGVVPAGGGCMRLYSRHVACLADSDNLYPALKATFETIGMARVSTSADEARDLAFLRPQDGWSMNGDRRIADARERALTLARVGFAPPTERQRIPVMGRGGVAVIESALINMLEGRFISEHDRKIGQELALILAGGNVAGPTEVSAEHMLDLERESFLRLCGESKTRERMVALLKTGKPLRN